MASPSIGAVHPPGAGSFLSRSPGQCTSQFHHGSGDLITEAGSSPVMLNWSGMGCSVMTVAGVMMRCICCFDNSGGCGSSCATAGEAGHHVWFAGGVFGCVTHFDEGWL